MTLAEGILDIFLRLFPVFTLWNRLSENCMAFADHKGTGGYGCKLEGERGGQAVQGQGRVRGGRALQPHEAQQAELGYLSITYYAL